MNEDFDLNESYKEKEPQVPPEDVSWHPYTVNTEKNIENQQKESDLISNIKFLLSDLSLYMRYDMPDVSVLLKLDWNLIRLNTNIDDILEKYDIPNVLLRLFECSYSPVVILALRITNFIGRNSLNLLNFMLDNLSSYIHLIRAPQFFPLICELIDGFCMYFPDAPERIQSETGITHMLCQLTCSMTPDYIAIACYILSQIYANILPDTFEDFDEIVKEPLCLVNRFISFAGTDIISNYNMTDLLSSAVNLLCSILHLYSGDFTDLVSEELFSKIVSLTTQWDSIDNTGAIYADVLKLWNIIMNDFKDFFAENDVIEPLIQTLVRTFKHPNCPIRRVLFTLSNLATFDGARSSLVPSKILQKCWKRIDTFDNIEKELYLFLFLNSSLLSPRLVIEIQPFSNIIAEAFDFYNSPTTSDYQILFIKALDCLLFMDEDSITSIIDRNTAESVFTDALDSPDEETATISQNILNKYFPSE